MNILKLIFELFIIYLLYKLVFDFILPVYRASKRMGDQMRDMKQKMQDQQQRQNYQEDSYVNTTASKQAPAKAAGKDYIEFEEIK